MGHYCSVDRNVGVIQSLCGMRHVFYFYGIPLRGYGCHTDDSGLQWPGDSQVDKLNFLACYNFNNNRIRHRRSGLFGGEPNPELILATHEITLSSAQHA